MAITKGFDVVIYVPLLAPLSRSTWSLWDIKRAILIKAMGNYLKSRNTIFKEKHQTDYT